MKETGKGLMKVIIWTVGITLAVSISLVVIWFV